MKLSVEILMLKTFLRQLASLASPAHFLFSLSELEVLFPSSSSVAVKTLLSRAVKQGEIVRVCRGIYLYDKVHYPRGLVLFHVAAKLRAHQFNYLSLETVLSDSGVISQIPINRITIMSSGRTSLIRCLPFGVIEFIHTTQKPSMLKGALHYDTECHLFRATVKQAIRDMKVARRNLDLINWSVVDEFV